MSLTERQLVKFLRKTSNALFTAITDEQWEKHTEAAASYVDFRTSVEEYHFNSMEHQAVIQHSLTNLDTNLNGFLKFVKNLQQGFTAIQADVKDDPELNKKVLEASATYIKNSSSLTEFITIINGLDLPDLFSNISTNKTTLSSQDKVLSEQAKSETSMAWNVGPRLTALESTQAALHSEVSTLRKDTSDIKNNDEGFSLSL